MIRSSVSGYVRRPIAQPPPFLPVVGRRLLHPCHGHRWQMGEADRSRDVPHAGRVVRGILRRGPAQVPAAVRAGRLSHKDRSLVAVLLADAGQAEGPSAAGEPAGGRGWGPEGHHVVVVFHAEAGVREKCWVFVLNLCYAKLKWRKAKGRDWQFRHFEKMQIEVSPFHTPLYLGTWDTPPNFSNSIYLSILFLHQRWIWLHWVSLLFNRH